MTTTDVEYTKLAKFLEGLPNSGHENDDRGPRLLWSAVALAILTTLVVGARIYTRLRILKFFGKDDYLNLCATAFAVALSAAAIQGVEGGGQGKHTWRILYDGETGVQMLRMSVQAGYLLQIFYNLSVGFSKAAVLVSLLRLQPSRNTRIVIYTLLTASSLYSIAATVVTTVQCLPIGIQWRMVPFTSPFNNPHCINKLVFSYAVPALNMVFNVLIFSIPLNIVMKLDLPAHQKVGLAISFLLGMVTCTASVMTLLNVNKLFKSPDPQYDSIFISIWFNAEVHLFIIGTNIPILRPLFSKLFRPHCNNTPQPLPDIPNTPRADRDDEKSTRMEVTANFVNSPFHPYSSRASSARATPDPESIGNALGPESTPRASRIEYHFRPATSRSDFDFDGTDVDSLGGRYGKDTPSLCGDVGTRSRTASCFLDSASNFGPTRNASLQDMLDSYSQDERPDTMHSRGAPTTAASTKPFFEGDPKVFG